MTCVVPMNDFVTVVLPTGEEIWKRQEIEESPAVFIPVPAGDKWVLVAHSNLNWLLPKIQTPSGGSFRYKGTWEVVADPHNIKRSFWATAEIDYCSLGFRRVTQIPSTMSQRTWYMSEDQESEVAQQYLRLNKAGEAIESKYGWVFDRDFPVM